MHCGSVRGLATVIGSWLAVGLMASQLGGSSAAAETSRGLPPRRILPPASSPPRGGNVAAPGGPLMAKPDYAVRVDSQQELSAGRMLYRFLVENKSVTPGGASKLTINVGTPCPSNQWKFLKSYTVPALPGGASAKVPTQVGFMVEQPLAGKGCHFEVTVSPPSGLGDANLSNNTMHLYTKLLSLPDLTIGGGGDNAMYVQNVGGATADPSTFHIHCQSINPSLCCWKESKSNKCLMEAEKDVSVPALKPKESFKVWGTMPLSTAAKQYWFMNADSKNAVEESNENNNTWEN